MLKLDWSKRAGEELQSLPHFRMRTATGFYFFPLVERDRWTLGRDTTCEIVLLDPLVSRRHAILTCSPAHIFHVIDLGSRNGSVVNGTVIQPMVRLQPGDRLRIGWTELEFHQP